MIDVSSLNRLVGSVTLQKGLDYARRGAVSDVQVRESPLRFSGAVRGSSVSPYQVRVDLSMAGPHITSLVGMCSCPIRLNCKHVVAVVLSGMAQRGARKAPQRATWERMLSPLLVDDSEEAEHGAQSVALQFEVLGSASTGRSPMAGPAGPSGLSVPTGLGIRPVQLGANGRWVRTGISWSTLGYLGYGRSRPRPDQLDWLGAVLAVSNGRAGAYYGSSPTWIRLEEATGGAFWDLLARAPELGIALIGSDKAQQPVVLSPDPVELVLDVARTEDGLEMAAVVLGGNQTDEFLLLGEPVRGLVCWPATAPANAAGSTTAAATALPLRERPLRLMQFRTPLESGLLALLDVGRQLVPPEDEDKFAGTYLPVLRQRLPVVSQDDSYSIPEPAPPELCLTVQHVTGQQLRLSWSWKYAGSETGDALWARRRAGAYRNLDLETQLVAALPPALLEREYLLEQGRLAGHVLLQGREMVDFLAELLPILSAHTGLQLRIEGEASYRAAESGAVIAISGEPSEQRDWFDLQISVTVDEEKVPLQDIFVALAQQQDFMILPSGTYFSLESDRFDQLAKLIEEARLLQEPGAKMLRLSRFQASLWDELQKLGIIDEQAAGWNARVGALLNLAQVEQQQLPAGFAAELRPYQQDGFNWLSFLFDAGLGGILADDMGLGKTIQALALICRAMAQPTGSLPFVVVAPTSVVGNWKSEAAKFAPLLKVATVTQTGRRRGVPISELAADADVVITSYALFRLEFDDYQAQDWAGLILDEAQFVKNHQSLGFKNAKQLSTDFKLAITGTPMENNLMELWSLFSISAPGLLGSPTRFGEYYQKPIERMSDNDRLGQLRRRIHPLMLRRTKEQVAGDLPPKQEQVIELDLNPRHQKVYQTHLQRERQKVLGLIGDLDKNRFTIFRSLTLLRQLSLDASLIDEQYASVPSTKLDALMEQLRDVTAEGHRVLVFSQFTSFLGRVRVRLDAERIEHCYLDGRTRNRDAVVDRFRTGAAPVFLISLKAGGFGLNLTEADYCILLDPWWNPATEAQAIDRTHRIGQTRTVIVYRLVAKGTIEEKVMALKENKAKLFSSVMNADAAGSTALTAEDIRGLLS